MLCRRQAIIWTNISLLSIGPSWTNFSEILIKIPAHSFKKMRMKMSSAKMSVLCAGLNVINVIANYVKIIYATSVSRAILL